LFHDVDFYVLSKDRIGGVDGYEHYATVIDEKFREDLFPPRKERDDKKYKEAQGYVFGWLKTHPTVKAAEIARNYPIRRQTVGKYLNKMFEDGLLIKNSATKYALAPSGTLNGHSTLEVSLGKPVQFYALDHPNNNDRRNRAGALCKVFR
jgi:hypothetical protein